MKVNNENKVLKKILTHDGISRAELSRELHLNRATTSYIIEKLEKNNIVSPREKLKETNGRHSVLYEINKNYSYIISINVQPTNVFVYVTNLHGECLEQFSSNQILNNENDLSESLFKIIEDITVQYEKPLGIGVAIHGLIDNKFNIKLAPNNNLSNVKIKDVLNERFPAFTFYIENEANISALGESKFLNEKNVINITNSTGIGCGIIFDSKIYKGTDGLAGEIGHTIVEFNGLPCTCGNKGCLEQYASEENLLKKASNVKGYKITSLEFLKLFNENDVQIQKIYFKSLDYLSIALHNLILLLNPSTLILTGYLYNNINITLSYIEENLSSNIANFNNYSVSDINKNSLPIGFTTLIVKDYFLKNKYYNS